MLSFTRLLLRPLAVVSLLLAGVAVAAVQSAPPAAAACASGSRTISGTVEGQDGRFVSAQVSFELFDNGVLVGLDGCPLASSGYAATILVNNKPGQTCCFILPGTGSASSPYGGFSLGTTWTLSGIPSNVDEIWIETYTKRAGGQPNTTTERFGHSIRRVPFAGGSVSGVEVTQPLRCGIASGGVTGSMGALTGRVFANGVQVTPTRVSAFSTSAEDGNGGNNLSFNVVSAHPSGHYSVDALAPGTYAIFVTAAGVTRRFDGLRVNPCATSTIDVAVSGTVPTVVGTPVTGDWDGDGGTDIGIFRPATREWLLRDSASAGAVQRRFGFGGPGDLPVVGDWNGDGADDVGVFRPSTREWLLRDSATAGGIQRRFGFGGAGDLPVVGDWDGDGDDGIGVFRPSSREWLLRYAATGGGIDQRFGFGGAGDRPVVGDWDGDGDDGVGVFRPSSREWLLRYAATGGGIDRRFGFGGAGDAPVVGNWDAVGSDGVGVYRPANGNWLLRQAATGGGVDLQFVYNGGS